jgi:hypothetical protein
MNCEKCNAIIPSGKLFCPNCGELNDPTTRKTAPKFIQKVAPKTILSTTPKKGTSIGWKLILTACAGVALIFISLALPYRKIHGIGSDVLSFNIYYFFRYASINVRALIGGLGGGQFYGGILIDIISESLFFLTVIGAGITALSAFSNHKIIIYLSGFTGLFGICSIVIDFMIITIRRYSFFYSQGFYVYCIGIMCLLISVWMALIDKKCIPYNSNK